MLLGQVSPQVFVKVLLALILASWFRKGIYNSVFSSRLHLDFDCAIFLVVTKGEIIGFIVMVKHFSVHMVQASLRQMNIEGTKHNFTPDMLFHLKSLEEKNQIVNMRETKLDRRNYHDLIKPMPLIPKPHF